MFQIRFTKLLFKLEMLEDGILPYYKVSAIRGGMGQMLLAQNCIGDRECGKCSFHDKCVVQNIMYAPCKIKLPYMTSSESMGYVIDCLDHRTSCNKGDIITVTFTFFGDAICYIMPVIYAITSLGCAGLGKGKTRFCIKAINNRKQIPILINNNIKMSNVLVELLGDYVNEMINQRDKLYTNAKVLLQSPCVVKYHDGIIHSFDGRSIVLSILQKIHMYNMYEGNEVEKVIWDEEKFPVVAGQSLQEKVIQRYSSTQDTKMKLKGVQGEILLENCCKEVWELLYAAGILHIGKNTHFGFGKIKII